jgi:hypothetical protein
MSGGAYSKRSCDIGSRHSRDKAGAMWLGVMGVEIWGSGVLFGHLLIRAATSKYSPLTIGLESDMVFWIATRFGSISAVRMRHVQQRTDNHANHASSPWCNRLGGFAIGPDESESGYSSGGILHTTHRDAELNSAMKRPPERNRLGP